ncbi:ABC transporter substrate-binding protein [Gordonia sp. DT30]|uniref:ABC transporter substrate-binding protein n=1 Tax=Gordonia sp. DT30 TaxID=3416546 RepID=UPI003CF8D477
MTEPNPPWTISRRGLFRLGGAAAVSIGGASLLAACGSSGDSSAGAGDTKALNFQLSWIKDVEFAGSYFAVEKGYYREAGLTGMTAANLLANPGSTTPEEVLLSGKAQIGLSSIASTAPAIAKGAPLVVLGAVLQKNPYCVLSLKEKTPVNTVAELKGKRVGVQNGDMPTWKGFLKANGIAESDVETVSTQFSPEPLEQGKFDALICYKPNQPVLVRHAGFTPVTIGLADHGLPFVNLAYIVTKDTLATKRDMIKSFLTAEVRGWIDAVRDPVQAAKYAVDTFGKDQKLDLSVMTDEAHIYNSLIVTEETNKNGLLGLSDALMASNINSLGLMGTSGLTTQKVFDMSIIREIFAEKPELIVQLPVT